MKIGLVSDAVYPYNKGGKEMRLWELSRRLVKRGHVVTVYTMKWWEEDTRQVVHDGVVYEAICPYISLYSGQRRSIRQGVIYALSCFKLLVHDNDVWDVDHMPFFPVYVVRLVTWLKGQLLFATWHEVWGRKYWVEYLGVLGNLAYLVEWGSMHLPDRVIANSKLTKRDFERIVSTENIMLAPLGIDFNTIKSIKSGSKCPEVIYVGRLLEHKHVDVLVRAMKLINKQKSKVRCQIIGDGPEYLELKKLIRKLELTNVVEIHQSLETHDQVISQMKGAKVLVLPSTREGFGLVVLEAMACGIPVITTDAETNAAKDLVTRDVGSVIPLDAESLAEEIFRYVKGKHSGKKKRMEVATGYDWEEMVDKVMRVYTSYN